MSNGFLREKIVVEMPKTENNDECISLVDELIKDQSLVDELRLLGFSNVRKTMQDYTSLLVTYVDHRDAREGKEGAPEDPFPNTVMKLIVDDFGYLSFRLDPTEEELKKRFVENSFLLYRDYKDDWMLEKTGKFKKIERFKDAFNETKFAMGHSEKPWVYLTGDCGEDRTHFLATLANEFSQRGHSVCFMNTFRRLDELKRLAIEDRDKFYSTIKDISDCSILILDDFGDEYATQFVRDQVLLPILFERDKNKFLTFFSSRYGINGIIAKYSGNNSSIQAKTLGKLIYQNVRREITIYPGLETQKKKKY